MISEVRDSLSILASQEVAELGMSSGAKIINFRRMNL
jgi:hypothetical protein